MWKALIQSAEGSNRTKADPQQNSFCLAALDLGHQLFLAFELKLKHGLLLGLEPASLRNGIDTIVSPSSQEGAYSRLSCV